jgi:membrane-associated phospholipid phosphatase
MSTTADTVPGVRTSGNDGWHRAWPLRRRALLILGTGGAAMLVVWSAVGLLFVHFLDDGPVGDADRWVNRWLADHRTPTWNTLTDYGSMLAETLVKVILVAVASGVMIFLWRRWHDAVLLVVAVSLEALVFVLTSFIVDRDRPPVAHLDTIPPSGSFPSGHAGAAVAFYGSLFVIACWHTRKQAVRWFFGVLAVVVPLIVAGSRVYRGMHHPIDVIAGLLLGLVAILVVRAALAAGVRDIDRADEDDALPERVRRLDLTTPEPEPVAGSLHPAGAPR